MSDVSDRIAKILEDPESLKMISEIAGNFLGSTDEKSNEKNDDSPEEQHESAKTYESTNLQTTALSTISSTVGRLMENGDIDNTVRLVTALKPYMSIRRRESADSVLRILSVMRLVGNSNIQDMVKLFGTQGK